VTAIRPADAEKLLLLEDEFARRLRAAMLAAPSPLTITSGYRSRADQQRLYDDYRAGRGAPANRPGTSKHELEHDGEPAAEAADVAGPRAWLHRNAGRFGLRFPYDHEPWHVESDGQPHPTADEELDMPAEELRAMMRAEVDQAVALVLRGSKTHPDHLKAVRADVAKLQRSVDALQRSVDALRK
jgi:FtsP/CotA-like multicopper oxidase with cupredoxin domain